ncbi:MAG: hypothetical protein LEGION0398_MBIBDBAK_01307 [Legionellaceae bacterium]
MKKIFLSLFFITLMGCAGKTANPISQYQVGDDIRNCNSIKVEIADNEAAIMKLVPQENKTGKNVALGVTGAFFLVPLFFMDFSDAERVEVEAYQRRNNYLRVLAENKHCGHIPQKVKIQTK